MLRQELPTRNFRTYRWSRSRERGGDLSPTAVVLYVQLDIGLAGEGSYQEGARMSAFITNDRDRPVPPARGGELR
jgi:hypothetical protein